MKDAEEIMEILEAFDLTVSYRAAGGHGYTGSERTTRRAVAAVRKTHAAGHRRVHRQAMRAMRSMVD